MAKHNVEQISIANLSAPTNRVFYSRAVVAGTIEEINLYADAAAGTDASFSIKKNGAQIASLTFGATDSEKSAIGLSVAVAAGDRLTVDATAVQGNFAVPLTVRFVIEDGAPSGGSGGDAILKGRFALPTALDLTGYARLDAAAGNPTADGADVLLPVGGVYAKNVGSIFTATLAYWCNNDQTDVYASGGIFLNDQTTGKSLTFTGFTHFNVNPSLASARLQNTFDYVTDNQPTQAHNEFRQTNVVNFLRVAQDAATRRYQLSYDGVFWRTIWSESSSSWIAPTRVGVAHFAMNGYMRVKGFAIT